MPMVVQSGSKGNDVKYCQKCLNHANCYYGLIDGWAGPMTVKAIKKFQYRTGHTPDGICGPKTWSDLLKYSTRILPNASKTSTGKSSFHLALEDALGSPYQNITQLYNLLKGRGYAYYFNDIYSQKEAIARLKRRLPLNCADSSQIFFAALKDLGYNARLVHVMCRSGTGHIQVDGAGRELGGTYVRMDPAAALKSSYPLGKLWCSNGKVIGFNPPWALSDDGVT